ncbi:MAG: LytTR family DNA-binding domain-containing protein [Bacteroidota bacterium]|nr:LytTR family DNA-binding domain-containing protein [Bacteroidota bacterium]
MNCLIVDDDIICRSILEKFVERIDFIEKVTSCSGAIEAIQILEQREEKIDLLFLDIEMPEMSGVDLMKVLKDSRPQIIVVSAKEKYAIEAYEFDVTDYLLKPVTFVRFYKAVDKAYQRYKAQLSDNNPETNEDFYVRHNNAYVKVKYNDILWIEALENYIVLNTFREKYTVHHTLKAVIDKLPAGKFFRVHRSYVVNLSKISMITGTELMVETAEGPVALSLGKAYRDKLLNAINVLSR